MRNIFYNSFQSDRFFGVELEISNNISKSKLKKMLKTCSNVPVEILIGNPQSINNKSWHIKNDASCGPRGLKGSQGYEITSYVGSGMKDINHIAQVADYLRYNKVQVNDYCGLHIHANAADLSSAQVGRLLAYWLKLENILGTIVPARRRTNQFCKFFYQRESPVDRNKTYTAEELWDVMKPDNLKPGDNDDRRVAFNVVNYARGVWKSCSQRKTLELRWPEGTLIGFEVKNWIRFFLHFIDYCKDQPMPDDLDSVATITDALSMLGLHHQKKKFYIFDAELLELKTWFLKRLIENLQTKKIAYWYEHVYQEYTQEAKEILNQMWSPLQKY
jgi:hypothetical protein